MSMGQYSKAGTKIGFNGNQIDAWQKERDDVVRAAINSVDELARTLEQRWGIGRLERLASPALAVAFEQARQNFNMACEGDDHKFLVQKADNLVSGWKALERYAEKNGHTPSDPRVLYVQPPADAESQLPYAIIEDSAHFEKVDREAVQRVYTVDELSRIIGFWESRSEGINKIKDTFYGSEITRIKSKGTTDATIKQPKKIGEKAKPNDGKGKTTAQFIDDEIPF